MLSGAVGTESCGGMQVALSHLCQPQRSLPSVAEDSGEEQSSSVLFISVLLPYQGPRPRGRAILLQQHPCPSPCPGGLSGSIPVGSPGKTHSSLQPWEHAGV